MRCKACDCDLQDHEATRKSDVCGDYIDLCDKCLSYIAEDMRLSDDLVVADDIWDISDTYGQEE